MSDFTSSGHPSHDGFIHQEHDSGHQSSSHGDLHQFGEHQPHWYNTFSGTENSVIGNDAVMHHADPLSVCNKFTMSPLKVHYVKPHFVNVTDENGQVTKTVLREGHLRSNPDGILENNLGYLFGKI